MSADEINRMMARNAAQQQGPFAVNTQNAAAMLGLPPKVEHPAVAFVREGYACEPGVGGTWSVHSPGRMDGRGSLAAHAGFTTWRDMMDWLLAGHTEVAKP